MWVRLARTTIGLCLVFLVSTSMAQAKDRVAVMDFENKSQHGGWSLGSGAADMLATEIVKTGKFQVMERDKLAAVIKEQDLGASGRMDPSTAAQIGKIVGVEYIITGAVTEYGQSELGGEGGGFALKKKGYHATVDIRMVNANTGEIVFADNATHSEAAYNVKVFGYGGGEEFDEKKATEVMRAAIAKLAVKINSAPLAAAGSSGPKIAAGPALVADVDGNFVVLNKGRNGGLQQGEEVTLYRPGKTITDPQTGKVLKVRYRKVGVIKLTTVDDGYAEGEAVSGSGFQVGDTTQAE